VDQRWILALPVLVGILFVGTGLVMFTRTGEQWLKGSLLLQAFGPGVITAPIGVGISCLLFPVAYAAWSVEWARDISMVLLLISFTLGLLSFAWSPRWVLPVATTYCPNSVLGKSAGVACQAPHEGRPLRRGARPTRRSRLAGVERRGRDLAPLNVSVRYRMIP